MFLTKDVLAGMWEENSRMLQKSLADELLVPHGRNGAYLNRDYRVANAYVKTASKFIDEETMKLCKTKKELCTHIPMSYLYRLSFLNPSMTFRYNDLNETDKENLFNDSKWVFTQKLDGCRGVLVVLDGKPSLFGRYFEEDCSVEDFWERFGIELNIKSYKCPMSVDVEITCDAWRWLSDIMFRMFKVVTYTCADTVDNFMHLTVEQASAVRSYFNSEFSGDLFKFNVLLPLYYKGKNYIGRPLSESFSQIDDITYDLRVGGLNACRLPFDDGSYISKMTFLKAMISVGFEGVVAYNMEATYDTSETRSRHSFVKIKKGWDNVNEFGDTIDAYVSGLRRKEGVVTAFEFSIDVKYSGGITKQKLMAVCALKSDGIDETWLGRVAEIKSEGYSVGTKLLVKPHIVRWRHDKTAFECDYPIESLKLMYL